MLDAAIVRTRRNLSTGKFSDGVARFYGNLYARYRENDYPSNEYEADPQPDFLARQRNFSPDTESHRA